MRVQEVMLKAIAGEIHWFRAAEILGTSPRSLRRWRRHYERHGYDGLFDHRRRTPSPRKVAFAEVERVLKLYREKYRGFNVRHFHQTLRREHGVALSYTFVKKALQAAGLVRRKKARGRHRMRREPRPCFGEMLLIDGSDHEWIRRLPGERQALIAIADDATSRLLYAQLWPSESTRAILTGLFEVVGQYGIPASLYSDRASWAFDTPKAGGPVNKLVLTRVGTVLKRLGIEHIPSYSPQARGRSERLNRTLQGRLVNELRVARVGSMESANEYLRTRYMPIHNELFARSPADPVSAFVSPGAEDLLEIFSEENERTVAKDNTVSFEGVRLQILPQPGRRSCAGLLVTVRRRLDGAYSIRRGTQLLGCYDAAGRPRTCQGRKTTHQDAPGSTISTRDDLRVLASSGPVDAAGPMDAANGRGAHKDLGHRRNGRRRPQRPQAASAANL
jgi:transposase